MAKARSLIPSRESQGSLSTQFTPPTGTYNIPVILINFSDRTPTFSSGDFDTLLFGAGNYSMKDYYQEISYGNFSVSSDPME